MAASVKIEALIAIEEDTDQGLKIGIGNPCNPKGSLVKSESFTDDLLCLKSETETHLVASSDDHDCFYGLHLLAEVAAAQCDDKESDFRVSCGEFDKNGPLFGVLAAATSGKIPRKRRSVRKKKIQGLCAEKFVGLCGADQFQRKRGFKRQCLETEARKSRVEEEQQDGLKFKKRRLVICHGGFKFNLDGAVRTAKREKNIHGRLSFGSGGSNLVAY